MIKSLSRDANSSPISLLSHMELLNYQKIHAWLYFIFQLFDLGRENEAQMQESTRSGYPDQMVISVV